MTGDNNELFIVDRVTKMEKKLGAYAMKRVAAGAHLPTPWFFEPAKRPDDRADYCLGYSFLPQWKHRVLVFTLEWSGAHPMGEHSGEGSAK